MANTYTQLHIHVVFPVKFRRAIIKKEWKGELYKYMTAIIQNRGHKVLAINGVEDHVHLLIGLRPEQALSDLMKLVKMQSAKWINNRRLTSSYFRWQQGYAAFSYSKSAIRNVIRYIENQEEHHRKKKFRDEIILLLKEENVKYDERYIFKNPE